MNLFVRIVLLVLGSALGFVGLAMLEEWPVFEPWLAGAPVPDPLPGHDEVILAVRAYSQALAEDRPAGIKGSMAWMASERDRAFRRQHGISQELSLASISVQTVERTGLVRARAITRERSVLTIARSNARPRSYELVGTWEYTLSLGARGVGIADALPKNVDLTPLETSEQER